MRRPTSSELIGVILGVTIFYLFICFCLGINPVNP